MVRGLRAPRHLDAAPGRALVLRALLCPPGGVRGLREHASGRVPRPAGPAALQQVPRQRRPRSAPGPRRGHRHDRPRPAGRSGRRGDQGNRHQAGSPAETGLAAAGRTRAAHRGRREGTVPGGAAAHRRPVRGRRRPQVSTRTPEGPVCATCNPPGILTCSSCGRTAVPCTVSKVTGQPRCGACARSRARCSRCGQLAPARAGTRDAPLCGDCAVPGPGFFKTCPACASPGRLIAGACRRCHLRQRLGELLADGTGTVRPELHALHQALATASRPAAVLAWLSSSTPQAILTELAAGLRPLTHAALDELPASKSLVHLRSVLVATGALPARDEHFIQLERWTTQAAAGRADPQEKEILHRYAAWHVLRRLRHRIRGTHATHGQAGVARRNITAAVTFLNWLTARGLTLASCPQGDLDEWTAAASISQRGPAGHFIRWARNQKLTSLSFPATRWAGPTRVIDAEGRWAQARQLLHDGTLKPEDRVAGLLVLLYAQQPATISRLTLGHVQSSGGEVHLRLGREPVVLPEPLAGLVLHLA